MRPSPAWLVPSSVSGATHTTGQRFAVGSTIIIRDTPLLRHPDLSFLPQLDLPFEQLTTLHFYLSFNTTQAVGILRRCQNLLDLFRGRGLLDAPILLPVELQFPRLERLEISALDAEPKALCSLMLWSSWDLSDLPSTMGSVEHLMLSGRYIKTQLLALQDVDILLQLKHLEIREYVRSYDQDDYRALTDILPRRHEEGKMEWVELFLRGVPPPTLWSSFTLLPTEACSFHYEPIIFFGT
ncbi:hypothetical protein DFH08DRAFT_962757 [Mycena albidolilacea]|uniref:Uncharacterized protein n=1 Tax=Mycena albidolilacea TaxID=1033008 RepID=A0AAD7EQ28_9AGAR|nr:hypothetical protein DFH08DRAFT_962757 [Mycena albidolilacea]